MLFLLARGGQRVDLVFRNAQTHEPVSGTLKIEQRMFFMDLLAHFRNKQVNVENGSVSTRNDMLRYWDLIFLHDGKSSTWYLISINNPGLISRKGQWVL